LTYYAGNAVYVVFICGNIQEVTQRIPPIFILTF
jgi:hypothetical protein